jgi:hypothetical protein
MVEKLMLNGYPVVTSDFFGKSVQARKHKKKRINKKWLKRYGYTFMIDPNVYFLTEEKKYVCHPKILAIIEATIKGKV